MMPEGELLHNVSSYSSQLSTTDRALEGMQRRKCLLFFHGNPLGLHVISVLLRGAHGWELGSQNVCALLFSVLDPVFNCPVFQDASLINLLKMQKLHFCFVGVILQCFFAALSHA